MRGRSVARALAVGRIAIGAGLLAAPRLTAGMWLGRAAAPPAVAPLARALGVREVVLGAMVLHVLDRPEVAARWLRAVSVCDVVDLAATVAARRSLPAPGVVLVGALASSAAAAQTWAARVAVRSPSSE